MGRFKSCLSDELSLLLRAKLKVALININELPLLVIEVKLDKVWNRVSKISFKKCCTQS